MDQATNARGVVGSSFTKQHQDAHRSSSSMSNRSNFDVSSESSLYFPNHGDIKSIFYLSTFQLKLTKLL